MLAPLAFAVLAAQAEPDVAALLRADYATIAGIFGAKELIEPEETVMTVTTARIGPAKIDLRGVVLESSRPTSRILVERIDVKGPEAVAIVGYARPHAPILYYKDGWHRTNGGWRLYSRTFLTGEPPLVFRDAPVADVLRALDDDKGHEWTLDAGANVPLSLDLTGLDYDSALQRVLSAAGAKAEPLPGGGTWIVPTQPGPRDPATTILSSLEFPGTEFRPVLGSLFKRVGRSYTIDPEVKGIVSVDLLDVPMEAALLQIVRELRATYRTEGGVYQIVKPQDPDRNPPPRIPGRIHIGPAYRGGVPESKKT